MSATSEVGPGDRVRFRAGRGHSEGRVAHVYADKGMVTIATAGGKLVSRKASQVSLALSAQASEQAAVTDAGTVEVDGHPTVVNYED